jgi:SulP family sulfate permease
MIRAVAGSWWAEARKGDLVGYLTDEEHARLLGAAELASVAAGDPILRRGSPSRSLILIEAGEVAIVDESTGASVVLATIGAGGVVGEVGFVDGEMRTNDVRAMTACRLRRLTRERLLELVKDDATLFAKITIGLAEILARRFREAVAELEPVRAFAASLGQPAEAEEPASFDEIDEPLPEPALDLIRDVARRAQKGAAGV